MDAVSWHSSIARRFDAKYASSPDFRERLAVWTELIGKLAKPDAAVLDAGCGAGILSCVAAARAASVLAFDASSEMLAIARERVAREGLKNVEIVAGAMGQAGLLDGRAFDLILCSSVLEYVSDYWAALDWLAAALAPGGVILFSMPNGGGLYRKLERTVYRLTGRPRYLSLVKHCPTPAAVVSGLAQRGFDAGELRYYGAAIGPARLGFSKGAGASLFLIAARRSKTVGQR